MALKGSYLFHINTAKETDFSSLSKMKNNFLLSSLLASLFVSAQSVSSDENPYKGTTGFISPQFQQEVESSVAKDSSIKDIANILKSQPTAFWLSSVNNLDLLGQISAAGQKATADKPVVITYVVYDIPGRDCSASASAGELKVGEIGRYKAEFIDKIASAAKANTNPNLKMVFIIEPDALPNMITNSGQAFCASVMDGYRQGLSYAIAQLSTIKNSFVYVDAGNDGWLGQFTSPYAIAVSGLLKGAKDINPASKITGFSTGVSNYQPFNPSGGYESRLANDLKSSGLPARFIVDTSRNGRQTPQGKWCNPKDGGMGHIPQAEPSPMIDAFAWIKTPGESDGASAGDGYDSNCDPSNGSSMSGAPRAGAWFHDQFISLIKKANPPMSTYSDPTQALASNSSSTPSVTTTVGTSVTSSKFERCTSVSITSHTSTPTPSVSSSEPKSNQSSASSSASSSEPKSNQSDSSAEMKPSTTTTTAQVSPTPPSPAHHKKKCKKRKAPKNNNSYY